MERFDPVQSSDATDALRSYGEWLQSRVSPDDALLAATRALGGHRPVTRRRRMVVVAVAGLLVISNVGLAAASDSAVPGDPLYGLKRAYEQIGDLLGVESHAGERLREAEVLLARGHNDAALQAADEALEELNIPSGLGPFTDDVGEPAASNSELKALTEDLVSLARVVHESAHDSDSRQAAIEALREQAKRVADMARSLSQGPTEDPGQGNGQGQGNSGSDHGGGPSDDSPSNTAPRNPNSKGRQP
ncbi:MAG TPA: hypothetical protein VFT54_03975 [Acidimicrobiia bacterium]|nr:hypothetical protein [Acidimicrobiia bacterium]